MKAVGILAVLAVAIQLANTLSEPKKVVCYFGSWSNYRSGLGKFLYSDIDGSLCTHAIYSFVGINTLGEVTILDPWNDLPGNNNGINNFLSLKQTYPNTKFLVAIGGYNEGSTKFSVVMASATVRANFVNNAVNFVKSWGFEGLDLDWEYPVQRGGVAEDKTNFVLLLKELRPRFDAENLLLSAAVSCAEFSVDLSYDIPNLGKYLDFINVMAYDLHGNWEGRTGQNAPLYAGSRDISAFDQQLNVDASIRHWIDGGAPASKIILGIGTYGQTYTLANPFDDGVGAPTIGAGNQGPYTLQAGMLGYNEICELQIQGGWKISWDDLQKTPYTSKGTQWVAYDDMQSVRIKSEYVRDMGLGGAMIWSLETDDFRGICHDGKFPLLRTINEVLITGAAPELPTEATTTPTTTTTIIVVPTTPTTSSTAAPTTVTDAAPPVTDAPPPVTDAPPPVTDAPPPVTDAPPPVTDAPPPVTDAPPPVTDAPPPVTDAPTTAEPGVSGKFQCTSEGYHRDPSNCGTYYYCQVNHGSLVMTTFTCPGVLVYDTTTNQCDYQDNVVC